jgi:hypothetical protein
MLAIINPPAIKHRVAISEAGCKFERPMIECPEVQPPAYRVPNPTKNPPSTVNDKPFSVNNVCQLKTCLGNKEWVSVIP